MQRVRYLSPSQRHLAHWTLAVNRRTTDTVRPLKTVRGTARRLLTTFHATARGWAGVFAAMTLLGLKAQVALGQSVPTRDEFTDARTRYQGPFPELEDVSVRAQDPVGGSPQRGLVIAVYSSDTPFDPANNDLTAAEIAGIQQKFDAATQFWQENSFGQVNIEFDVHPRFFQLPEAAETYARPN